MKDIQQLIKKNIQEGRYEDIFPKTFIDAVEDRESGNNLNEILSGFNMYFLSYIGSRELTRLQVPLSLRKTGLWITYVLYDKTVVTEWYAGEAIDDNSWRSSDNWRVGSNMLVGDISISSDGYWVVNGVVTTTKAQGEQGITPMLRVGSNNHLQVSYTNGSSWVDLSNNPVYTQFRVLNNKLQQSTDLGNTYTYISEELAYKFQESGNKLQMSKDLGNTWEDVSDYIAAWFKFTGTTGSSQADNVGKIQISRDNGVTWSDLSGEFTNSLHIKGYVATVATLPSSAVQGDIYGVGPTYDPSDTEQTNPIYQLYVKDSTGWVNNGKFTSIAAGVVQTTGTSITEVMSQDAVSNEFASVRSDLNEIALGESFPKNSIPIMSLEIGLTINKLNLNSITANSAASSTTGLPTVNLATNLSDYIEVKDAVSIVSSQNGSKIASRWYAYDENYNFIPNSFSYIDVYAIPDNTKYVRVAYFNDQMYDNWMVNFGTTAVPYTPYKEIINPDYIIIDDDFNENSNNPIANKPVALLSKGVGFERHSIKTESLEMSIPSTNKLDISSIIENSQVSSQTGLPVTSTTNNLSDYIDVKDSVKLSSWSSYNDGMLANFPVRWCAYDANYNFIPNSFIVSGIYSLPVGTAYVRVAYPNATSYTNHMVIFGENAPSNYEPYKHIIEIKGVKLSEQENDVPFVVQNTNEPILPLTLYAFAGIEININLPNIIDNDWNDVYCRITSSNRGKLYSKKWKYTPPTAETFTFQPWFFNKNYQLISDKSYNVIVKDATIKSSLKILVIGDSTVQAGVETQKMLDMSIADGYSLSLLGTRGVGLNQHEGRGGWTANMYAYSASNSSETVFNAFYNPVVQRFDFSYYMQNQGYTSVDCIFLQLGINDIFAPKKDIELNPKIDSFLSDMDLIINSIHEYDANINIVINLVIPCSTDQDLFALEYGVTQTTWRSKHNSYLLNKNIIAHYSNVNKVFTSWYHSAIDSDNEMLGDVHPNTDGYNSLGKQMYSYMRAIN